jgi:sugar O-acyltransferase (sialic acid O-acetyltransferase NeuD family)
MSCLVIFGSGQIAELAHFYFTHDSSHRVVAFTVDGDYVKESGFLGLPVVAFEELDGAFPAVDHQLFVAVSYSRMNRLRIDKFAQARAKGYRLAHYVSSRATVWPGFEPRPNQLILEDNTIQPFARVGANVTLWSGNHIGHHATIGDHCFVASHVVISGNIPIDEGCFLGDNTTIREGVAFGKGCLIGAGALILKDTGDDALFAAKGTEKSPVPACRFEF